MGASTKAEAARLLRDAVLWRQPRSYRRSVAYLSLVVLASFIITPQRFSVAGAVLTDGHALASMELAMARAYCGHPTSFSSSVRIPYDIRDQRDLRHVPLRTLLNRKAGSVAAYCRTVVHPFVNNENSLLLVETAVLRLAPGVSAVQLAQILHAIRIVGLAAFVLLLIVLGGSLAFALAALISALIILNVMQDDVYSAYPFLFVELLVAVAFYGFALQGQWTRRPIGLILCASAAGVLSAFITNMRTSHLPIVAVFFVWFLSAEFLGDLQTSGWARAARRALLATGCFVVGFAALQHGLITRFVPEDSRHNASHSIGHPLVLAIGVPENALARELGIRWLDAVGGQKALSVDPEAAYLGPRYDKALLEYYAMLWRTRPRDMLAVYLLKFSVAGTNMLSTLRASSGNAARAVRLLFRPLDYVPNGLWLLGVITVTALTSMAVFVRRGWLAAFTMALLSLAACLVQFETALIYSLFVEQYYNFLAFYVLFVPLAGLQLAANLVWSAGRYVVGGRPA